MKKKAILIVGMHRSGTSALGGCINILGAFLGTDLLPAQECNPKGFFENKQINIFNEYVLNEVLKSSWDDTEEHEIDFNILYLALSQILKYIVRTTYRDAPVIAIKDPRICLLLPLYDKVLTEMGYEIHYIRTFRDEEGIIQSIMKRDGFERDKCEKIIRRNISSLDKSLQDNYTSVLFDDLVNNQDKVIYDLSQHFAFLDYSEDNKTAIRQFIDKSLKHF